MTDGFNFKLSSPLTKEDWNKICDAELEHTKKIVYKTPSGKEVTFISLAELEEIKAEIETEINKEFYLPTNDIVAEQNIRAGYLGALAIVDKRIKEIDNDIS